MSADRQRLKSAIQRIAKEGPEIRNLLGEGKNKGSKASSAGVGTSEAEESRLCCDGSASDNANPGTEERDPDSGSQDGLDPNDPAKLGSGDGILSGVTDCATGDPVCFDGGAFVPPDGWDGPSAPPPDPTWEEGYYYEYEVKDGPSSIQSYPQEGIDISGKTKSCSNVLSIVNQAISVCDDWGGQYPYESCASTSSSPKRCNEDPDNVTSYSTVEVTIQRRSCEDFPDPEMCDGEPPLLDYWPADGCTNLAIVNGSIVGSKYDPENDGSYSAPRDSIDLCSGTEQISLAPAANGGWKTINSTTNSGYLYDSSGKQIAHIDGNEYSDPNV